MMIFTIEILLIEDAREHATSTPSHDALRFGFFIAFVTDVLSALYADGRAD